MQSVFRSVQVHGLHHGSRQGTSAVLGIRIRCRPVSVLPLHLFLLLVLFSGTLLAASSLAATVTAIACAIMNHLAHFIFLSSFSFSCTHTHTHTDFLLVRKFQFTVTFFCSILQCRELQREKCKLKMKMLI